MYPNSILSFNIFAEAMIGKLFIDNGQEFLNYDDDPGKEFVEDLIVNDVLFMGNKWFGLPDFNELNQIVADRLGVTPVGGGRQVGTMFQFGNAA